MPSSSPEAFLATLAQSGLVGDDLPARAVAAVGPPVTAARLADWFVRQGHLTAWQSENLQEGRSRGYGVGHYVILQRLGSGGMGQIYLGRHRTTGDLAAIKVLGARYNDHKTAVKRFEREAQCIARLDHPNVVQVYDFGVEDGRKYIALEYVEGRTVERIVAARGALPANVAADLAWQAAQGLAHAHGRGLIHRDIKPSNLLLGQDGVLRVLDFGLASIGASSRLTIEADERILGTADYISPEQAVNSHAVDARTDQYGLGGTLYFLLTGRPPFDGTVLERIEKHRREVPPPVATFRPDVPPALTAIVERLMAKSPGARFPDADAAAETLARFLADQPPLRRETLIDLTVADRDPPPSAGDPADGAESTLGPGPSRRIPEAGRPGGRSHRDDTNPPADRPTVSDEDGPRRKGRAAAAAHRREHRADAVAAGETRIGPAEPPAPGHVAGPADEPVAPRRATWAASAWAGPAPPPAPKVGRSSGPAGSAREGWTWGFLTAVLVGVGTIGVLLAAIAVWLVGGI